VTARDLRERAESLAKVLGCIYVSSDDKAADAIERALAAVRQETIEQAAKAIEAAPVYCTAMVGGEGIPLASPSALAARIRALDDGEKGGE
jgi:hypothetical protein